MSIYSPEELKKYCEENKIELLENYDKKATSKTFIEGKCLTENCNENFRKLYSVLLTAGGYCRNCALNNGKKRRKETSLEKYGVEFPTQTKEIKEKSKKTCLEKYGVEFVSQNKNIKEKKKKTSLINFGVEFPMQNKQLQENRKKSNFEKYGVEFTSQLQEVQEKGKQTCLKKFGVEYASQNLDLLKKREETSIERFGCKNAMQNEEVKNKYKQGCINSFGYENPYHCSKICERALKTAYTLKNYTLPSKKVIQIQGYENFGMDELLFIEKIDENDIIISRKKVPEIWYKDKDGKEHRYFVDFYIPCQKRCIEIKSTWTLKKDNVFEKQQAMKEAGYQCEIWVFDDKGNKLECYK
jgi:hypothetical protein